MVKNEEVKKIREKKFNIYKGLQVVLSTGRKIGRELCDFDIFTVNSNDIGYINALLSYIIDNNHDISCYNSELNSFGTYENLIQAVYGKDFNDDISCVVHKLEKVGDDLIFALIYNDKIDSSNSRFDVFVINTKGEKR